MINTIKSFLRNHFGFSRSETNGLLLLLPIIFFSVFSPLILKKALNSYSNNVIYDKKAAIAWKKGLEAKLIVAENEIINSSVNYQSSSQSVLAPKRFNFNANTVNYNQLVSLGFSNKVAKNWTNYLKANGNFKNESDLSKIYGISQSKLKSLTGFIKYDYEQSKKKKKPIQKATDHKRKVYLKNKFTKPIIVEGNLNLTNASDLMKIRGIGERISERIIKFRDQLGGFHTMEQLNEVYGLDSIIINQVKSNFFLKDSIQIKIPINSINTEDLASHPYFGKKLAKIIINYRKHHGSYQAVKDLSKIHIISDSLLSKMTPYLQID